MEEKNLNVQETVDCATTSKKEEMMSDINWQEVDRILQELEEEMKDLIPIIARHPNWWDED